MAFPKLVRNARTPVRVVITSEDTNEFGERLVLLNKTFYCNYQDSATIKYTSDKRAAEVTGTIYIDGDIMASLGSVVSDFSVTPEGALTLTGCTTDGNGTLVYEDPGETAPYIIASGYVVIFGRKREIVKGCKARNLDGTVNYTRLDVK
jgi:formylmethanofuran dehydrogenase subunit C